MNVIKLLVIFLACTLFVQVNADDNVDYYENAFLNLYQEYELAYEALNRQIEKCSLKMKRGYDFSSAVKKCHLGYPDSN